MPVKRGSQVLPQDHGNVISNIVRNRISRGAGGWGSEIARRPFCNPSRYDETAIRLTKACFAKSASRRVSDDTAAVPLFRVKKKLPKLVDENTIWPNRIVTFYCYKVYCSSSCIAFSPQTIFVKGTSTQRYRHTNRAILC